MMSLDVKIVFIKVITGEALLVVQEPRDRYPSKGTHLYTNEKPYGNGDFFCRDYIPYFGY